MKNLSNSNFLSGGAHGGKHSLGHNICGIFHHFSPSLATESFAAVCMIYERVCFPFEKLAKKERTKLTFLFFASSAGDFCMHERRRIWTFFRRGKTLKLGFSGGRAAWWRGTKLMQGRKEKLKQQQQSPPLPDLGCFKRKVLTYRHGFVGM